MRAMLAAEDNVRRPDAAASTNMARDGSEFSGDSRYIAGIALRAAFAL